MASARISPASLPRWALTSSSFRAPSRGLGIYGESLNRELKGTGVSCTVLCPGVTATEFFNAAGQNNRYTFYQRLVMMRSAEVARIGIDAALRGKPAVLSGFVNKLQVFGLRLTPRWFATFMAYHAMRLR